MNYSSTTIKQKILLYLLVTAGTISTSNAWSQKEIETKGEIVQETNALSEDEQYDELEKKLRGTYQCIISSPEKKMLFSLELLKKIEKSRQYNQSVTIEIENDIVVIVPSYVEINATTYQNLEKVVYQIKPTNYAK